MQVKHSSIRCAQEDKGDKSEMQSQEKVQPVKPVDLPYATI